MKMKTISLSLIGAVLSGVLNSAHASAPANGNPADSESAALLQELIERGHLVVDPSTGQIRVKRSVYEILKEYEAVQREAGLVNMGVDMKTTHKCG